MRLQLNYTPGTKHMTDNIVGYTYNSGDFTPVTGDPIVAEESMKAYQQWLLSLQAGDYVLQKPIIHNAGLMDVYLKIDRVSTKRNNIRALDTDFGAVYFDRSTGIATSMMIGVVGIFPVDRSEYAELDAMFSGV